MEKLNFDNHFKLDVQHPGTRSTPREEAEAALERLQSLSYDAAVKMENILKSTKATDNAKIQVINIVLDRVYGRPEEMLQIRGHEHAWEESAERIRAYAENSRKRREEGQSESKT